MSVLVVVVVLSGQISDSIFFIFSDLYSMQRHIVPTLHAAGYRFNFVIILNSFDCRYKELVWSEKRV